MSVLFGIDEKDSITICADRRASSKEGKFISDDLQKITVVNPSLAFASAGNAAIEKAVAIDADKAGVDQMNVDGLLAVINAFYDRVKEAGCDSILLLPFYCLIAGTRKDGSSVLINLGCVRGKLSYAAAPMALYPPADAEQEKCNISFVRNYKLHKAQFCENTVREISEMSSLVSPTGDKWIFDKATGTGKLYSF